MSFDDSIQLLKNKLVVIWSSLKLKSKTKAKSIQFMYISKLKLISFFSPEIRIGLHRTR